MSSELNIALEQAADVARTDRNQMAEGIIESTLLVLFLPEQAQLEAWGSLLSILGEQYAGFAFLPDSAV